MLLHPYGTCRPIRTHVLQPTWAPPGIQILTYGTCRPIISRTHMQPPSKHIWTAICKYADDTYLIIPAYNCHSRCAELDHIDTWARRRLHLNWAKCAEIVFTERRCRRPMNPPQCLPDLVRVSSIKILGVTIICKLSCGDHVNSVMSSCAQLMHALRTLRSHGMDTKLMVAHKCQPVYNSIVTSTKNYRRDATFVASLVMRTKLAANMPSLWIVTVCTFVKSKNRPVCQCLEHIKFVIIW